MQLPLGRAKSPSPANLSESNGNPFGLRDTRPPKSSWSPGLVAILLAACNSPDHHDMAERAMQRVSAIEASDLRTNALTARKLDGFVAVDRGEFNRLLTEKYAPLPERDRATVLEAASYANLPSAIGVTGTPVREAELTGQLVIVLDSRAEAADTVQSQQFSFAGIQLHGVATNAVVDIQQLFDAEPVDPCSPTETGCFLQARTSGGTSAFASTRGESAGATSEVLVDAETLLPETREQLPWIPVESYGWPTDELAPNRYVCVGKSAIGACSRGHSRPFTAMPPQTNRVPLSPRVFMVSERDYHDHLVRQQQIDIVDDGNVRDAISISMLLNGDELATVTGKVVTATALEADILLVARDFDPKAGANEPQSRRFYVAPGPIKLTVEQAVGDLSIALAANTPLPSTNTGFCSFVSHPEQRVPLWGEKIGAMTTLLGAPGNLGFITAAPSTRVTVRIPETTPFGVEESILACSLLLPPGLDLGTNKRPMFGLITEDCDGVDNNGNGLIDENDSCRLPLCAACQPRSCGVQRCVTLPDGCGAVVSCGCP